MNKKVISICLTIVMCLFGSFQAFAISEVSDKKESNDLTGKIKHISRLQEFKEDQDFNVINDDGNGGFTIIPGKNVKDKKAFISKILPLNAQIDTTKSFSGESNHIGYSDGILFTSFSTTATKHYTLGSNDSLDAYGVSYLEWTGYTPRQADEILSSDTFSIDYIGLSISVSISGPGGSVSGSSSSRSINYSAMTPQNTYNQNWFANHTYTGIHASAYEVDGISQGSSATFRFGTTSISPTANGEVEWTGPF